MSNALTPTSQSRITRQEAEERIGALRGALAPVDGQPTRFCVPRDRAATTAERRMLSAVQSRLERELEGCANRDHVEAVVSRILLGFEKGRTSDENVALLNSEFVEGLLGLPLAAIHAAATRFRTKTTLLRWDPAFRPSPGQFAAEVREGMIPQRAKLVRIRQILDAEVYDPPTEEDRAKVQAAAAAWLQRGTGLEPDGRPTPAPEEIAQARESHLHELGARVRESADVATMDRLMGRIEARAPRQDEEVGA